MLKNHGFWGLVFIPINRNKWDLLSKNGELGY